MSDPDAMEFEGNFGLAGPAVGTLLVASPDLADPSFAGTVVLVLDHDHDGALGLVLNRPLEVGLDALMPEWSGCASAPDVLHAGGPVSRESALALAVLADPASGPRALPGWRAVTGRVGLLDLDVECDEVEPHVVGIRVFAGYAGWGADQLEAEVDEGSWFVVASRPDDVLRERPELLWRDVMRRQRDDLRWYATHPDDPSVN